jgi:hypothetical protein
MNDNSLNPARLIYAIEILLAQLDAALSPQMTEGDGGADRLKIKIDGYKEKAARLKTVLSKAQAADRRKRDLARQNRQNTKAPVKRCPSGQQRNSSRQSPPY